MLNRVYDDAGNLIEGALVVPERMIMQLLFPALGEMGIAIKANGVDYTYEYDAADEWKTQHYTALTSSATWDNANTADPMKDLATLADTITGIAGATPTVAIMNKTTFNLIGKTQAVKDRFLTTVGRSIGYIADNDVKAVIKDVTGIDIIVYDKQYKNESGVAAKYVPDDYVALVPEGELGYTWFGTTPEEADLLGKASDAQVAIVNTGIAITQIIDPHPVNVNTFASEIVLPSFERMNECGSLKVK